MKIAFPIAIIQISLMQSGNALKVVQRIKDGASNDYPNNPTLVD